MWASVQLCLVEDPAEVPTWFVLRVKILKVVDSYGKLAPIFSIEVLTEI